MAILRNLALGLLRLAGITQITRTLQHIAADRTRIKTDPRRRYQPKPTLTFPWGYQHADDGQEWFRQIRELAAKHGFVPNAKEYKNDPEAYPSSIREASQIIRIAVTGSTSAGRPGNPGTSSSARQIGAARRRKYYAQGLNIRG
jgi:hypothetical protein